eukprot:2351842-Ditylum_brightwellii.AAC.1
MASPGFIMNQHLTITRKDHLHSNIAEYLETVDTEDNPMIQEWIKKHQPDWDTVDNPIPDFTLSMSSRKFGNSTGRVETMEERKQTYGITWEKKNLA